MLGTYKIKKSLTESEKHVEKGGLQPDFKAWVLKFTADAEDKGYTALQLKGDGFVSFASATDEARSHNSTYLDNQTLFCRGLAWEFGYANKNRKEIDWFETHAGKYGLAMRNVFDETTGALKSRFLRPKSVKVSGEYDDPVTYEGDEGESLESDGESASSSAASGGSVSSVAYFFSNQFRTFQESMESEMLTGERALANDKPVYDTVKEMCAASLRSFSSTPSGEFVAWYPDYWGKSGNTPVMTIPDIELLDLKITQSDDEFYSHVYCTGVDQTGQALSIWQSQGVVSIESNVGALVEQAELNDGEIPEPSDKVSYLMDRLLYIPEGERWKYTPRELYRRYGARPAVTRSGSAQLIEDAMDTETGTSNPTYIMPFLQALHAFMEHWANQNRVTVDIAFNPSIIPGCRIELESLDISFYVKGVTHTMDYSSGFTTKIEAVCPKGKLVSGMVSS